MQTLRFSNEGTRALSVVEEAGVTRGDAAAVVLAAFSHETLFVDFEKSDFDGCLSVLSAEVERCKIRYPFIHYRLLYEKYFRDFGAESVDETGSEIAQQLLEGTPQGVFQIGSVCCGPFGLLQAPERRYLPITRSAPLAHCTDPGCRKVHPVHISSSPTDAGRGFYALSEAMRHWAPPSAWDRVFSDMLVPDDHHYADFNAGTLTSLLASSLSDRELRHVAAFLMSRDSSRLRKLVTRLRPRLEKYNTHDLVEALDRADILQLSLLSSDELVCRALDTAVRAGVIEVPPTEVRTPMYVARRSTGAWHQRAELSSLGIRFTSPGLGPKRLLAFLESAFSADDLRWLLLDLDGRSISDKLNVLVRRGDIRTTIERLVLERRETYERATAYLRYGDFPMPSTRLELNQAVEQLMWKFGFDVNRYPALPGLVRRRLTELESAVSTGSPTDLLRSAAVNLFVSLEEFLDSALSFAAFALLEDHYGGSPSRRFVYNLNAARQVMAAALNGRICGSGAPLNVVATGKNNLYALIHGFRELAEVVDEKLRDPDAEKASRRPESLLPLWARNRNHLRFPFVHRVPAFDLEPTSLQVILDRMRTISLILISADVMGVRNRIPHGGHEVPSAGELRIVLTALDEVLSLIDEFGFSPLVHYQSGSLTDAIGRGRVLLDDHLGRVTEFHFPGELDQCGLPPSRTPQVIFGSALIRGTSEVLRFAVEEDSDLTDMWREYPHFDGLEIVDSGAHTDEKLGSDAG